MKARPVRTIISVHVKLVSNVCRFGDNVGGGDDDAMALKNEVALSNLRLQLWGFIVKALKTNKVKTVEVESFVKKKAKALCFVLYMKRERVLKVFYMCGF